MESTDVRVCASSPRSTSVHNTSTIYSSSRRRRIAFGNFVCFPTNDHLSTSSVSLALQASERESAQENWRKEEARRRTDFADGSCRQSSCCFASKQLALERLSVISLSDQNLFLWSPGVLVWWVSVHPSPQEVESPPMGNEPWSSLQKFLWFSFWLFGLGFGLNFFSFFWPSCRRIEEIRTHLDGLVGGAFSSREVLRELCIPRCAAAFP